MKNFIQIALSLYLVLGMMGFPGVSWAKDKKLVIGGKNFTEQYILPEMAKILLEKQGFEVVLKTGVGSTVLRQALENGEVGPVIRREIVNCLYETKSPIRVADVKL